ncbi:hypothetical protein WA026_010742 [Henosepilachna vigintioctopunctata]|uniref:Serine/threonine-protein kinase RIO3 n=1 Tax=Henosepilachna vigintioctopunctata TaxID=420089 RepID=A0AAW1V085_9CUCU
MSSPWAKIETPEPVNFHDIISEQVAADLAKKEELKFLKKVSYISDDILRAATSLETKLEQPYISDEVLKFPKAEYGDESIESDAEIARIVQYEFDREHDKDLIRNQDKYNGSSKVSISFRNFMRSSTSYDEESETEEVEDIAEKKDWDRFDTMERELGSMPTCGYKIKDGNIVTKHDTTMSGRRNACKLLSFPPEFQTGDGENFDLKLSNKVYNSLKMYSRNEQSRRHKIRDKKEDRATAVFGLDEHTTLLLYKMMNNQLLEAYNGVISIGKEAVILHADGCLDCEIVKVPKECVIKVFKTTLSEFKQRDKYIKDDHRFRDRIGKQTSRKTVHIWAEKEMANLCRLKKAGIPCPEVVMLKEHVLIMSFIGENYIPAKKLKDADMDTASYIVAYQQVVDMMKDLFHKANLIHADLSEYNILWYNDQCIFIDVSQSVEPIHENAFNFLFRDCRNITNFFERKLVPQVATPEELFQFITGYNYEDKEQLSKLQMAVKPKPHNLHDLQKDTVGSFDKIWEAIESQQSITKEKSELKKIKHLSR